MDEVKSVVWGCAGKKSSGPDGLNFNFIKAHWDIIKKEFFDCIKYFEATGNFYIVYNPSFIVLIPKINDPLGFSDIRPISLIGCVYKIISKILATRLAKVNPSIISPNQSAFISGRQILDGCLIANEIINMAKLEGYKLLFFKVDFENAFDMLINGSLSKKFRLERGLHQGDPLSYFLFLLVAEALQISILEACNKDASGLNHSSLPFIYLGLLVGRKKHFCDGWTEVISSFYGSKGSFGGFLNDGRKHGVCCDILRSLDYIENLDGSFGSIIEVLPYLRFYALESLAHCLISCSWVKPLWRKVWSWCQFDPSSSIPLVSVSDFARGNISSLGNPMLKKIVHGVYLCVLWAIWRWRNNVCNAHPDHFNDAKTKDIFSLIQRLSLL
ncbi:cysteine-rich receptor-like protein kinase [Tanacetum coccineum]